jgi:hypothetical protein
MVPSREQPAAIFYVCPPLFQRELQAIGNDRLCGGERAAFVSGPSWLRGAATY